MQALVDIVPWLIAMVFLIGGFGFFSGSEAALFCLRWQDRRALRSGNRAQRLAERLLSDPDRLLSAVLFWNLVINIAYFAVVSIAVACSKMTCAGPEICRHNVVNGSGTPSSSTVALSP